MNNWVPGRFGKDKIRINNLVKSRISGYIAIVLKLLARGRIEIMWIDTLEIDAGSGVNFEVIHEC